MATFNPADPDTITFDNTTMRPFADHIGGAAILAQQAVAVYAAVGSPIAANITAATDTTAYLTDGSPEDGRPPMSVVLFLAEMAIIEAMATLATQANTVIPTMTNQQVIAAIQMNEINFA